MPHVYRSKRIYISIVLIVGLALSAVYLPFWRPAYWQARSNLNAMIAQQRASGFPVRFSDWADLDPAGYEIGKQVEDLLNQLVVPSFEFTQSLDKHSNLSPEQIAELRQQIERNVEVVSKLKSIERIVECRFQHDFRTPSPPSLLLPMYDKFRALVAHCRGNALLALHDRDDKLLVASIVELASMSELLRKEPFLVSFLIRLRALNQAIDLLELFLASATLTPEQFVLLDDRLQSLESNLLSEPAIRGEATFQFTTLENIGHPEVRKALEAIVAMSSSGEAISVSPGKTKLARWGAWSYRPELMSQQILSIVLMSRHAELVDQTGASANQDWADLQQSLRVFVNAKSDSPIAMLFPAIDHSRNAVLAMRTRLRAARIAIRVIRFYQQNGELPERLEDVCDETLSQLPLGLLQHDKPELSRRSDHLVIGYEEVVDREEMKTRVNVQLLDAP